jgi:hypothetical protein
LRFGDLGLPGIKTDEAFATMRVARRAMDAQRTR